MVVSIKVEVNLKMYVEVERYLLQTYIYLENISMCHGDVS